MRAFFFVLLSTMSTACAQDSTSQRSTSAMPGGRDVISQNDIAEITSSANNGDLPSIHRMIQHNVATGGSIENLEYWFGKAAERGDSNAMLNLAGLYIEDGGAMKCSKAIDLIARARTANKSQRELERADKLMSLDCH